MINVKKNYRKIENKKDNDMDADVAQLECSDNKSYTLAFRYIQIDMKLSCRLQQQLGYVYC